MLYQDDLLYYLWKPAGIPSTRGGQRCFLDMLKTGEYEHRLAHAHHEGYHKSMHPYFLQHIQNLGLRKVEEVHATLNSLLHTFSPAQEFGLLNRLDTPTAGFLYFAKTVPSYIDFKLYKKEDRLIKHYIAKVDGHVDYLLQQGHHDDEEIIIEDECIHILYPLMHHIHLADRMTVLLKPEHITKGRGEPIFKKTTLRVIAYDIIENKTLLHITIHAGARHQIRAHVGALGYPILGETIYAHKKDHHHLPLHLWSVGCEVQNI